MKFKSQKLEREMNIESIYTVCTVCCINFVWLVVIGVEHAYNLLSSYITNPCLAE